MFVAGRPEPLDDKASSSNGNAMALNSTASINGGSGSPVNLVFCIMTNCVHIGRGNAPCFCCAAMKPKQCYETREECNFILLRVAAHGRS